MYRTQAAATHKTHAQPPIRELAVISDRAGCALLDQQGTISWYCPRRFDAPAVFSLLLDEPDGGFWAVEAAGKRFLRRTFLERSSVLQTVFATNGGELTLTDWMPLDSDMAGIARTLSPAPVPVTSTIRLRPNYGQQPDTPRLLPTGGVAFPVAGLWLYASHALAVHANEVSFTVPAGEAGWAFLSNAELPLEAEALQASQRATLAAWQKIAALFAYEGLYQQEVIHSIRAIQQLVYAETSSIIAAATTSLPEVLGGERNYDYRYVWMRDVALITGALSVLETEHKLEYNFLKFVTEAMRQNQQACVTPLYKIDHHLVEEKQELPLPGYLGSQPVIIGNTASKQRQLDAEANILIAAKIIYDKYGEKSNWETVAQIADYICHSWDKEDNGIWEEGVLHHYTSSKVYAARGLEFMAAYNDDPDQADRWRYNAGLIRQFVAENCLTKTGAYASYAGSQEVDISAVLFALWTYVEPDDPTMLATVQELEARYCRQNLYWRRLEEFDSHQEGAFLAGSCWMAHYYAAAGNTEKARAILDAVASYQNDLGYFSEEADVDNQQLLGNFAQTFVHSSFICAANGLSKALQGIDTRTKL